MTSLLISPDRLRSGSTPDPAPQFGFGAYIFAPTLGKCLMIVENSVKPHLERFKTMQLG